MLQASADPTHHPAPHARSTRRSSFQSLLESFSSDEDVSDDDAVTSLPAVPQTSQSMQVDVSDPNYLADDDRKSMFDSDEGEETLDVDDDAAVAVSSEPQSDEDVTPEEDEHNTATFLQELGGSVRLVSGAVDQTALRTMQGAPVTNEFDMGDSEYPELCLVEGGPTSQVTSKYESPIDLLLQFCSRAMWNSITVETNRYERQRRHARALAIMATQRRRQGGTQNTMTEVKARMRLAATIDAHEIVRAVGLLIGNVLMSHVRGIGHHWKVSPDGSLPGGSFGRVIPRNRFQAILSNLHPPNKYDRDSSRDKAWKIRSIVTVMEATFRSAWSLTPRLSFDEGMLPSTSRRNTTRMYMQDKPHRFGTKMFML